MVGAGVSGLACARALAARGVAVTIFEKSRGVGGRAATRRVDTERGALRFDHGAQYFTARDPAFAAEVDALAARELVAPWAGRVAVLDRGAVHDAGAPGTEAPRRWVAVPGMSALGGALATGLDVRLGTRIDAVQRAGTGWRLASDLGDAGSFDAVVVATPAPQAAPLLAAAAPPLALAASGAAMTPCWSVMLAVDAPLALPFDGAFVGARATHASAGSPLAWVARDSSKPRRAAAPGDPESWVLHASAEWSAEHLEVAAGEVAARLVAAFAEAAGLAPIGARFVAAHRWRFATPAPGLADRYLFAPAARVGACGDWCGGARVEGAYLSGIALAGELLAALA